PPINVSGFGLNLNYQFLKILVETNTSYYFNNDNVIGVPEVQFVGGLYLKSKFFGDNLNLKSGFTFYYTGKRNSYSEEREIVVVEPSTKLDFILIGEIQELAIVYFVWENMFDNQYFITPYYPMPERSIRFGLSWELFN
ncbi:MAG: putative porin, partial [Ignavibacteria bacterium]|nr:putative porin [Ignavibacteria bacterium]